MMTPLTVSTATSAAAAATPIAKRLGKLALPVIRHLILPAVPVVGTTASIAEAVGTTALKAAPVIAGEKGAAAVSALQSAAAIVSHATDISNLVPSSVKKAGLKALSCFYQNIGSVLSTAISAIKVTQAGVWIAAGVATACAVGKFIKDRYFPSKTAAA
jgi:hypothetical protein